jgi:hypothetical protein
MCTVPLTVPSASVSVRTTSIWEDFCSGGAPAFTSAEEVEDPFEFEVLPSLCVRVMSNFADCVCVIAPSQPSGVAYV